MKISDVEKITGLTAKAIRLYEEKGLITVERKDNSYREYNENSVNRLKQIKLLRDIGIGISEIVLYYNNIVTLEELLHKRKKELEKESNQNKENYYACIQMLDDIFVDDSINNNQIAVLSECKSVIAIDIGTTSISAVIIDAENNCVLETYTVDNDSKITTDPIFSEFDVERIIDKSKRIVDYLIKAYPNTSAIGITGQMHGVVYTDKNGNAVSPLYNWQDSRGNCEYKNGKTYCEEIEKLTGYRVFSGYGFSTLFYNKVNKINPENAYSFCTIMDYFALYLAGLSLPIIHPSNAASLGLFDLEKSEFDVSAIEKIGLNDLMIPTVSKDDNIVGHYCGIPVVAAIGDNQASFFGSVKNEKSALVNFGTGSQISVVTDTFKKVNENLELRPYLFGKYLVCGSALCGGRAYSILEKFFSSFAREINSEYSSSYDIMDALAEKAYNNNSALKVSTLFCGTRNNPDLRGSIEGISDINFKPENLILGFLQGMVNELKEYFDYMNISDISGLTASGNAVQKTPVLQKLLIDTFGYELSLTDSREEAAIGAALYAGLCCDIMNREQISEIIKYK